MTSLSKMLAIPGKTITNIIRTFKRTGNTEKKPMSGGKERLSLRYRLHLQLRDIPSTFKAL